MITLTRLSGTVFALNSDLIERVDATPDTVITLVDGKKYVVVDDLEDVVVRRAPPPRRGAGPEHPSSTSSRGPSRSSAHLGTGHDHPTAHLHRIDGTDS